PSPAATRPARPATRTMKNSSRLPEKMARNLSRSSSGTDGSSARASTRALNSSHERSRSSRSAGSAGRSGAFLACLAVTVRSWSHGGDALDGPGFGVAEDEVLVGGDPQDSPHGLEQLPRAQEEGRVLRPAEALLTERERLVEEDSAPGDGGDDLAQDRPVQVVGHHHGAEGAAGEGDGVAGGEIGQPARVAVDGRDRMPPPPEEPGVAAAAAGHVEDGLPGGDEQSEAGDP